MFAGDMVRHLPRRRMPGASPTRQTDTAVRWWAVAGHGPRGCYGEHFSAGDQLCGRVDWPDSDTRVTMSPFGHRVASSVGFSPSGGEWSRRVFRVRACVGMASRVAWRLRDWWEGPHARVSRVYGALSVHIRARRASF